MQPTTLAIEVKLYAKYNCTLLIITFNVHGITYRHTNKCCISIKGDKRRSFREVLTATPLLHGGTCADRRAAKSLLGMLETHQKLDSRFLVASYKTHRMSSLVVKKDYLTFHTSFGIQKFYIIYRKNNCWCSI